MSHIRQQWSKPQELLIIDGGSSDGSWEWLQTHYKKSSYQTNSGRGRQMNFGVQKASKKWLYFLHIDSRLTKDFDLVLSNAIHTGVRWGCFRLKFNQPIGYCDKQQLAAGGTTPFVEVAISRFLFPKKILTA